MGRQQLAAADAGDEPAGALRSLARLRLRARPRRVVRRRQRVEQVRRHLEWDGTNWQQKSPAASPGARSLHSLAYDAQRRRTVLFGGGTNDTWEYDGTNWVQRTTPRTPPARSGCGMAYDPAIGKVVMCGGSPPGPSSRPIDTWTYGTASPASVASFGIGCPGAGGTPQLASYQGSLPWIGDVFSVQLTNIGANPVQNVPFVVLGDSKAAWGAYPLPLSLAIVGMPGCTLYVNWLVAFTLANTGGSAVWNVPVPANASFVGASLYVQGVVTSPGTNTLGAVMSNAVTLNFGAR
jgi:hypothetical protein